MFLIIFFLSNLVGGGHDFLSFIVGEWCAAGGLLLAGLRNEDLSLYSVLESSLGMIKYMTFVDIFRKGLLNFVFTDSLVGCKL